MMYLKQIFPEILNEDISKILLINLIPIILAFFSEYCGWIEFFPLFIVFSVFTNLIIFTYVFTFIKKKNPDLEIEFNNEKKKYSSNFTSIILLFLEIVIFLVFYSIFLFIIGIIIGIAFNDLYDFPLIISIIIGNNYILALLSLFLLIQTYVLTLYKTSLKETIIKTYKLIRENLKFFFIAPLWLLLMHLIISIVEYIFSMTYEYIFKAELPVIFEHFIFIYFLEIFWIGYIFIIVLHFSNKNYKLKQ